ncbi:putative RNA-directed DNA polymerase from transposon X-element, partial [Stegodyphus mimosarum]
MDNNSDPSNLINIQHINYAKIVYFNCNGVYKQHPQIIEFLQTNNIDIMLLNETHLKPNKKFKIPNYTVYRNDRLHNRGGGTAIIIKNSMKHTEFQLPNFNSFETCGCLFYSNNSNPYLIISIYKPPNNILDITELEYIINLGYPTIIAGDLNCKHTFWNSNSNNNNGLNLYNYMLNSTITIHAPNDP